MASAPIIYGAWTVGTAATFAAFGYCKNYYDYRGDGMHPSHRHSFGKFQATLWGGLGATVGIAAATVHVAGRVLFRRVGIPFLRPPRASKP